ncbi:MAG: DUF4091 domain-containing protein, partial [candidate division WS1 bacterium]|nr:DUF4091 domain-containing protein [candidate division WS1 bacterium]
PAAPFTVRGGTLAAVWVDVLLPPGTPAGVYQGMVTISAGGQEVSRIVEVRARGFDLPCFTSFESELWYNVYNWDHFYGKVDYTPEMHARHADVLGRYRVGSIPVDMVKMCPKLTIYHEPDGHFSFDFSEIDKFIKQGLENGSRSFWSCFACCAGWTWWLNDPSRPVIERADGKTRRIGDYVKLDIWNGVYDPATYKHNPLYREFLVAYVEHLKQLGINDFSYWELFDEPNDNSRWLAMLEHHKWLREVVPDLKLLNFGVDPTVTRMGKNAWGLIDAWAPHLHDITPEEDAVIKERRAKYGEKYWGYTCGERNDGQGNYSPYIRYDRPYISARMHYWATWRHQMDGFLVFASSGVPEGNRQKGPEERWPNSDWVDGGSRGCGTLVYPGADFELIPGMRLANLREGLEDQEYFILLRELAKALDPVRDAALLARVNQGLEIEPEIMADAYHWTKDPVRLEAKREQLSRLILEVQATGR